MTKLTTSFAYVCTSCNKAEEGVSKKMGGLCSCRHRAAAVQRESVAPANSCSVLFSSIQSPVHHQHTLLSLPGINLVAYRL
jgi:DNA-directed RNA polymerase subunit RPC12/RpoP